MKNLTQRSRGAEENDPMMNVLHVPPVPDVPAVDGKSQPSTTPHAPWPRVKLGEVCEDKILRLKNLKGVSRIAYIDIASIDRESKKIIGSTFHEVWSAPGRAQQVVQVDDLLISTVRPNLNAVAMIETGSDTPLVASTGFSVVRAKQKVLPKYLFYYSQTDAFIDPLVAVSEKASYPSVTDSIVKGSDIPLPPLPVQRSIVARLERELGAVEKVTKAFEELERAAEGEFKAELKETFEEISRGGAETRRLGDVCELKNGYTPPAAILSEKGAIPYFRISAMNLTENSRYMVVPTAYCVDSTKRCFKAGSIVFPKNGGAVFTRKVRELAQDSIVDLNTGVMTTSDSFDKDYALYWFKAIDLNAFIVTGTIPFVDFNLLRDLEIVLPSLPIQREIVARLDAARERKERLVSAAKRGREAAALWRKAILKEAFE